MILHEAKNDLWDSGENFLPMGMLALTPMDAGESFSDTYGKDASNILSVPFFTFGNSDEDGIEEDDFDDTEEDDFDDEEDDFDDDEDDDDDDDDDFDDDEDEDDDDEDDDDDDYDYDEDDDFEYDEE